MNPIVLAFPLWVVIGAVACIKGHWLGPTLFALGFLAVGVLMVLGVNGGMWAAFGIGFVIMGIVELLAAGEFWLARPPAVGPDAFTRASAALVGVGGSVGLVVLLMLLVQALVGFYSQL